MAMRKAAVGRPFRMKGPCPRFETVPPNRRRAIVCVERIRESYMATVCRNSRKSEASTDLIFAVKLPDSGRKGVSMPARRDCAISTAMTVGVLAAAVCQICCSGTGSLPDVQTPVLPHMGEIVYPRPNNGCPPGSVDKFGVCAPCGPVGDCRERCEKGSGDSCAMLALSTEVGANGPKDRVKARALYERGCGLGSLDACEGVASCYAEGDVCPRDIPRAYNMREALCAKGKVSACRMAASMSLTVLSRPTDGLRIADRACQLGDADSCRLIVDHCRSVSRSDACPTDLSAYACALPQAAGVVPTATEEYQIRLAPPLSTAKE